VRAEDLKEYILAVILLVLVLVS